MPSDRLLLRDAIGSFAPSLRAALFLTYSFDGKWLEEAFIPDLFDRQITTAVVVRDRNVNVGAPEAPSVRYHRANAAFSERVFHSKLGLFVADDRALAVIGSANLTRGGLERNLELGASFQIGPDGGPRAFFEDLLQYVGGPLLKEVSGSSAVAVRDTEVALRDVLLGIPKADDEQRHHLLHNYDRPLWNHILDALPHRNVARLTIVSPFFETNSPEAEDPASTREEDGGLIERAFTDLKFVPPTGEKPVAIYFQQSEGKTLLPIDKLKSRADSVELFQRLSTNEKEPRPLHAKLLLIEGAKASGKAPYLVMVCGSPNFTAAAYLSTPPAGNAELAVLTRLPAKKKGSEKVRAALGLEQLFGLVNDWGTLRYVSADRTPLPRLGAFRLGDVELQVASQKLTLTLHGTPPNATALRALIQVNGAWTVLATTPFTGEAKVTLDVPSLLSADGAKVLQLNSPSIRVELVDDAGNVVATSDAPINVDCANQFCGLSMVGPLMSTLDERIAFAGCGVPQTYRDQQKFLEQHRAKAANADKSGTPVVLMHQADLDRFFRNLHSGFRGLRSRSLAMPSSEVTFRRNVRDLTRWCGAAISPESKVDSDECRLFLLDRVAREIERTLEAAKTNDVLRSCLDGVITEFQVAGALKAAATWVGGLERESLGTYSAKTSRTLTETLHFIATEPGR